MLKSRVEAAICLQFSARFPCSQPPVKMFFGGPGIQFVNMGGGGIPMGGMPFGMGGMPGMGEDDDDDGPETVDNTEYYETLGVTKEASQQDIKKAYMKLARVVRTFDDDRRRYSNTSLDERRRENTRKSH